MDEQPAAPTGNFMSLDNPITPPAGVTASGLSTPPAAAAPGASALPGVPETWPGAFGAYKYSKQAVKPNVGTLIVLWLVSVVIGFLLGLELKSIGQLVSYVIDSLATAAFTLTYIAGVRGQRFSLGQALSGAMPFWLKMIGLNILVTLSYVISALLLLVPFFFVVPRLALANYFLVDKKMGVMEAYKASWAATKGNVGKIYGIIGATILMALLMLTIIGIPFSIYFLVMYSAASAILYEFINQKAGQPVFGAAPAPAAAPDIPTAAIAPTEPADPMQPVAAGLVEPNQSVEPDSNNAGSFAALPSDPPSLPPEPSLPADPPGVPSETPSLPPSPPNLPSEQASQPSESPSQTF